MKCNESNSGFELGFPWPFHQERLPRNINMYSSDRRKFYPFINEKLRDKAINLIWQYNHIYPTPPLGQDMTQGQLLSGV